MKFLPSLPAILRALLLSLGGLSTGVTFADVSLPPVFSDHLVLQRGMAAPIWGTASPNEKITLEFRRQTKTTTADADGKWMVKLDPLEAGGPDTLTVKGNNTIVLNDVLVGEVWLGSGQSNMQIFTSSFTGNTLDPRLSTVPDHNLEGVISAAPYPNIRIIASAANNKPLAPADIHWTPATAEALKNYSAQLTAMGVNLSQKLNVPMGLMLAAIGGSPSSRWITKAAIAEDPACKQSLAKANANFSMEKEQAKYQEARKKYEADHAVWEKLTIEEKKTAKEPGKPNPPVRPGEGQRWEVGDLHNQVLSPFIGYGIRGVLWDQGESGAMINGIDQNTLMAALFRSWREEWAQGDFPFVLVQKPSGGGCAFDYSDKVYGWASDPFLPLPGKPNGRGEGREAMIKLTDNPNTFLVPTSDLGSHLHPANKFAYGARDARVDSRSSLQPTRGMERSQICQQ